MARPTTTQTIIFNPNESLGFGIAELESGKHGISIVKEGKQGAALGMLLGDVVVSVGGDDLNGVHRVAEITIRLRDAIKRAKEAGEQLPIIVERQIDDAVVAAAAAALKTDDAAIAAAAAAVVRAGVYAIRDKGRKQNEHCWAVVIEPPFPDGHLHCKAGAVVLYDLKDCKRIKKSAAYPNGGARYAPRDNAFSKLPIKDNCSKLWRFARIGQTLGNHGDDSAHRVLMGDLSKIVKVVKRNRTTWAVAVSMWVDKTKKPASKPRLLLFDAEKDAKTWALGLQQVIKEAAPRLVEEEEEAVVKVKKKAVVKVKRASKISTDPARRSTRQGPPGSPLRGSVPRPAPLQTPVSEENAPGDSLTFALDAAKPLGFGIADLVGGHHGINRVAPGTQAEAAGIMVGDSIVSIGGDSFEHVHGVNEMAEHLRAAIIRAKEAGGALAVELSRPTSPPEFVQFEETEDTGTQSGYDDEYDSADPFVNGLGPNGPPQRTCFACKLALPLGVASMSVNGKTYHATCCVCVDCKMDLTASGVELTVGGDGALLCSSCGKIRRGEICVACGTPLVGEFVVAIGKRYHKACFACAECSAPLGAGTPHIDGDDGKPYCTPCGRRRRGEVCSVCDEVLADQFVAAIGKRYHKECFQCSQCNGVLEVGKPCYQGRADRKLYCEPCAPAWVKAEAAEAETHNVLEDDAEVARVASEMARRATGLVDDAGAAQMSVNVSMEPEVGTAAAQALEDAAKLVQQAAEEERAAAARVAEHDAAAARAVAATAAAERAAADLAERTTAARIEAEERAAAEARASAARVAEQDAAAARAVAATAAAERAAADLAERTTAARVAAHEAAVARAEIATAAADRAAADHAEAERASAVRIAAEREAAQLAVAEQAKAKRATIELAAAERAAVAAAERAAAAAAAQRSNAILVEATRAEAERAAVVAAERAAAVAAAQRSNEHLIEATRTAAARTSALLHETKALVQAEGMRVRRTTPPNSQSPRLASPRAARPTSKHTIVFDPNVSLGFGIAELESGKHGISNVRDGAQGQALGMLVGDVLISVGGDDFNGVHRVVEITVHLRQAIARAKKAGKQLTVVVKRDAAVTAAEAELRRIDATDGMPYKTLISRLRPVSDQAESFCSVAPDDAAMTISPVKPMLMTQSLSSNQKHLVANAVGASQKQTDYMSGSASEFGDFTPRTNVEFSPRSSGLPAAAETPAGMAGRLNLAVFTPQSSGTTANVAPRIAAQSASGSRSELCAESKLSPTRAGAMRDFANRQNGWHATNAKVALPFVRAFPSADHEVGTLFRAMHNYGPSARQMRSGAIGFSIGDCFRLIVAMTRADQEWLRVQPQKMNSSTLPAGFVPCSHIMTHFDDTAPLDVAAVTFRLAQLGRELNDIRSGAVVPGTLLTVAERFEPTPEQKRCGVIGLRVGGRYRVQRVPPGANRNGWVSIASVDGREAGYAPWTFLNKTGAPVEAEGTRVRRTIPPFSRSPRLTSPLAAQPTSTHTIVFDPNVALGFGIAELESGKHGISYVGGGTQGQALGMLVGDVVVSVDGDDFNGVHRVAEITVHLREAIARAKEAGKQLPIVVERQIDDAVVVVAAGVKEGREQFPLVVDVPLPTMPAPGTNAVFDSLMSASAQIRDHVRNAPIVTAPVRVGGGIGGTYPAFEVIPEQRQRPHYLNLPRSTKTSRARQKTPTEARLYHTASMHAAW